VSQLAVRGPAATIGREPGNDLVLDSPIVSGRHARLTLANGVWTITDLGSINGTWVDGERVEESLQLAPGSEVRLGDVVLSFAPRDEWSDSPGVEENPSRLPVVPGPLFLPADDSAGSRRWLIGGVVLVILGIVAWLLLASR
jgi:pSer/pThr/pTyr-binding forkhead associated (FHA) protein